MEDQESKKLNDKQQMLLDDLKHVYSWQHSCAWDLFYYLVTEDREMFEEDTIHIFQSLPEDESLAVVPIFIQWVLDNGDQ